MSKPRSSRPGVVRSAARRASFRRCLVWLLLCGLGGGCGSLESRKLEPSERTDGGTGAVGGGDPGSGHGGTTGSASGGSRSTAAGGQSGDGGESEPACGNGRLEAGEGCDDGNTEDGDGCSARCHAEPSPPACGDGEKARDEECDDGNLQVGDGCDDRCRIEACGNGRVDAGEECDPPAAGRCTVRCARVRTDCGDGVVQADAGEECDDGNDVAGDGCSDCRKECGDGRIDHSLGEECEPEYWDNCSDQCKWLPTCGDGEVQPSVGEECDPDNGTTCVECRLASPCSDGGEGGCGGVDAGECVPAIPELVQNGGFTRDTSGWSTPGSFIALASADDGSPEPRALEVSFASGPVRAVSGAYECLPIEPKHSYVLSARYKVPSDAPDGVGASVTTALFAGTRCDGTPVGTPLTGPFGGVRDQWTPYSVNIDASALPAGEARLLLRLNVVRPANIDGVRVLWDSASIPAPAADCGNCTLDAGETCDDGTRNGAPGDACRSDCQRLRCGDGVVSGGEECDDGNATFERGDGCTPSCKLPSACDTCSAESCASEPADPDACFRLEGVAEAGPAAGTARSTLCDELRTCVRDSACDLAERTLGGKTGTYFESCYCGTSGDRCFDTRDAANGSCKSEIEAALETTEPSTVLARLDGSAGYPLARAAKRLIGCENGACGSSCVKQPACGNGYVEDRNLDFELTVNGKPVDCDDRLTLTGRGCSFEECDDGNTEDGDGCDEHCFIEACGNYVVQAGEDCDDGNTEDGDGCSHDCKAEYQCGNGVLEPPFEECGDGDPAPMSGAEVCTPQQYASDPSECQCDDHCRYVVCGNGIPQPPEECDPPNGVSCGNDCKHIEDPCQICIHADAGTAAYQVAYCDPDPACIAVEQCILGPTGNGCFSPVPATCYCGTRQSDLDHCDLPEFVPVGPCADTIKAGAGGPTTANLDVLNRLFAFGDWPTGTAISVLDVASRNCAADCASNLNLAP